MLSIGDLSRRAGVKIPTIRYYEQMGLITAPERTEGNQRRYTKSELERLSFIRHTRGLAISIDAIRELIHLSENPTMPCGDAHKIANTHLSEISAQIAQLQKLQTELIRITSTCDAKHIGACYVIQSLSNHALCVSEH